MPVRRQLDRISLAGYKSIRELDLELRPLNVLIGANGSGKSNFIGIFKLLNHLVNEDLQLFIARSGGADQLLHYGRQVTDEIAIELWFGANGYSCRLVPAAGDTLIFAEEMVYFHDRAHYDRPFKVFLGEAHKETLLLHPPREGIRIARYVRRAMQSWQLYHFHDTSASAKVKQLGSIGDNLFLRPDASNLAAYLYLLRETEPAYYRNIVDTIRLVAPFFRDFVLRPSPFNPDKIKLEWQEKGSDAYFDAHSLSDGTLRFISLTTLLLQPPERLPATILLDEPELGLHPYAIAVLAEMLRSVTEHTQVIIATQSVTLVNQFEPEDILIVDRDENQSVFRRLSAEEIKLWLEDYGLGDLWEKNLLGGRPAA